MSSPIEVRVTLSAFYVKEGKQWVITCPALRLAAQGNTLAHAKREFNVLFLYNLEYWQRGGHFGDVIREALKDPGTKVIPDGARRQSLTLSVPPELLAATYGPKQKTIGRKAA